MEATNSPAPPPAALPGKTSSLAPLILAAAAFALLFAKPATLLASDWWNDPEAGHGLLLAPLAVWLGWKRGFIEQQPQKVLGAVLLIGGVALRYLSGLAAELFTMRMSMVIAAIGVIVFFRGYRQVFHWWLPVTLLALSIPIPDVLTGSLALPLQLTASRWGAALLQLRHVPVVLTGNIIRLPGRDLFVTEACSGLRSLTALLALGVLVGGLWLRHVASRVLLIGMAIPVAMVVNAFRVFLTGFLVHWVDPKLGEGFMHLSEGWLLFVVAFVILGGFTWAVAGIERRVMGAPTRG
ncbi:MAG: exosortase/archaeosortase family protein [Gemmatimonadota bacterium]